MLRTSLALGLSLAWLAAGPAASAPAQEVDHPAYKSWAAYKVGTQIVIRSVTEVKGNSVQTMIRTKLVAIDPAKLVLEEVKTSNATGTEVESAPQEYTVRRKFPLLPGVKPEDIGKPPGASVQGKETIRVGDRSFEAVWFESKGNTEGGPSITRTWMSDEVPGRLVKAVVEVPKARRKTTQDLIEIKTPE